MGRLIPCAVPGCGRILAATTRSGVCRAHNHSQWCACAQCTAVRPPACRPSAPEYHPQILPLPPAAPRLDPVDPRIRQVRVPNHGTYSGVSAATFISLPRAPWEAAP